MLIAFVPLNTAGCMCRVRTIALCLLSYLWVSVLTVCMSVEACLLSFLSDAPLTLNVEQPEPAAGSTDESEKSRPSTSDKVSFLVSTRTCVCMHVCMYVRVWACGHCRRCVHHLLQRPVSVVICTSNNSLFHDALGACLG